jgi:hypothetical protein
MNDETGDRKICGYMLATEVRCYEPRVRRWCAIHDESRWLSCVSCHSPANRECPEFNEISSLRCGVPLCHLCTHIGIGNHKPYETPMQIAHNEMSKVVETTLSALAKRGVLELTEMSKPLAAKTIIDDLVTHTTLKTLSGISLPPEGSRT